MHCGVARSSEFSPTGNLILDLGWGSFFEKIRSSPCTFFSGTYKLHINFDLRMGWATFWAIFSQTNLVTLFQARATFYQLKKKN
jgi:hypothetical protein